MSLELDSYCLKCWRGRCIHCPVEYAPDKAGGKGKPLYSTSQKNRRLTENEALRGEHLEFEALQEISQPLTERASLLSTGDQVLCSYPNGSKVPLIHHSRSEPGPISGVESEISKPSLIYDREYTPHSCLDTTDPPDSLSSIDKDANNAVVLFGEDCLGPRSYLKHQSGLSTGFGDPIDQLLLNTVGAETSEIAPIDPNLEIAYDGADAVQPQRHQWDVPSYPLGTNAPNISRLPDDFHYLTSWTHDAFQLPNAPCQLLAAESLIDQSEISSPLQVAPFSPSLPCHKGTDQQHITRKGSLSSNIRACESCRSTANLDGRPLACVFYKHDPNEYFKCSLKEFKTIGHMRQHLDKHHKLAKYYCKRCWASFHDEGSLKTHTGCQPMGGIPVNDLAPISKARGINPNSKWYWTYQRLFGENSSLPQCPYPHPKQDLRDHTLDSLHRNLEGKGTNFTIDEIKEVTTKMKRQTTNSQSIVDR